MDFEEQIKKLSEHIEQLKSKVQNEDSTKLSFILPFIEILGYETHNPAEVFPEYTCDLGIKKGEKIDYAILKDNKPIILIECKHWKDDLNLYSGQLFRYFQASNAKLGILTNGIIYRFYSDLKESNKMDDKPFLEINLTALKKEDVEELKKFHKSNFNLENILSNAKDLMYINELKNLMRNELANPSDQMVRFLTKPVYSGAITSKVVEQFREMISKAINSVINDFITEQQKKENNLLKDDQMQDENVPITKLELYPKTKKLKALCIYDPVKKLFILQKGSEIVLEPKRLTKESYKLRDKLIESKDLQLNENHDKYILQKNIPFHSPSTAGSFVTGLNQNGYDCWKDANNKPLEEYRKALNLPLPKSHKKK